MKEKILYGSWAGMYLLCAGLGFVTNATGMVRGALVLISVLFFVPALLLLLDGITREDKKAIARIRWICIASLALTMVVLIANLFTVNASVATGNALFYLLIIVSSPMVCSQYWVLSLFLWSCLLMGTLVRFKK